MEQEAQNIYRFEKGDRIQIRPEGLFKPLYHEEYYYDNLAPGYAGTVIDPHVASFGRIWTVVAFDNITNPKPITVRGGERPYPDNAWIMQQDELIPEGQQIMGLHKEAQRAEILKWMEIRGEIKALKAQIKALGEQEAALETDIVGQLKELDEQAFRVDTIMAKVKQKAGRTTTKWKPLFEKTYALVHAQVKNIVDGYKKQLTTKGEPKEYLDIEEAPPIKEGFYRPEFHSRVARLNSVLSGVLVREFAEDEDHIVRAFAILASDDINKLRQAVVLDNSPLVQKAAVIKLSRLAPALVAPLKETDMAKYAQEGDNWYALNKLTLLIDILEEIAEEM